MASILCRPQYVKERLSIHKWFNDFPGHKIGTALGGGTGTLYIV